MALSICVCTGTLKDLLGLRATSDQCTWPQVDLASAFSAGLLAGAALGVILPEGFESFGRAQAEGGSHSSAL